MYRGSTDSSCVTYGRAMAGQQAIPYSTNRRGTAPSSAGVSDALPNRQWVVPTRHYIHKSEKRYKFGEDESRENIPAKTPPEVVEEPLTEFFKGIRGRIVVI